MSPACPFQPLPLVVWYAIFYVRDQIHQGGFHVDVDTIDRKVQKKVN